MLDRKIKYRLEKKIDNLLKSHHSDYKKMIDYYRSELRKLSTKRKSLGSFNYESYLSNELTKIESLLTLSSKKDTYRRYKIIKAYDDVVSKIYFQKFQMFIKYNLESNSLQCDFEEIIYNLKIEADSISELYLNPKRNPNIISKHFFKDIDLERWKEALVKGALVDVLANKNNERLFYSNIKGKISKTLIRCITTALYYGLDNKSTLAYIKLVHDGNYGSSKVYPLYERLKTKFL